MTEGTREILAAAKGLPPHSLATKLRNPRGQFDYTFRGALLLDYARAQGMLPASSPAGLGEYYFWAAAEDGFTVTVACAEVLSDFTDKQVLLAWEQNGEPLNGGVRLVVPGDDLGGRSIHRVARIEVRDARFEQAPQRPPSSGVSVSGLVERPLTLDLDGLKALPQTDLTTGESIGHGLPVAPRRYAGVRLWSLLKHAGLKLDPSINEDVLRKVIVARSTDGYASVIAAGEVEPRFGNGDVLVATSRDGVPLTEDEGGIRLVVAYDKQEARSTKALAAIEVREG